MIRKVKDFALLVVTDKSVQAWLRLACW